MSSSPGQTTLLLMLGHVPLRDVELLAVRALEGLDSCVFSKMYFQVASSIVLLGTSFNLADELILILMGPFVVTQYPFLSKLAIASRVRAYETSRLRLIMGCHVII